MRLYVSIARAVCSAVCVLRRQLLQPKHSNVKLIGQAVTSFWPCCRPPISCDLHFEQLICFGRISAAPRPSRVGCITPTVSICELLSGRINMTPRIGMAQLTYWATPPAAGTKPTVLLLVLFTEARGSPGSASRLCSPWAAPTGAGMAELMVLSNLLGASSNVFGYALRWCASRHASICS